jgi:rod shape determining protein RodA
MILKFWEKAKYFDWILLSAVLLLIAFGLLEIYSVALSRGGDNLSNFYRQIVFVFLGLGGLFVLANFDYHNFRSYGNYAYIIGFLLLVGVLFFGKTVRGTQGWYDFGFANLQPVEFVKLILIVYLAKYFSVNSLKIDSLKHILKTGLAVLVLVALVMMQPDFGSSLLLLAIWAVILLVSGIQKRYVIGLVLILSLLFLSGWFVFFEDYQKNRILTFLQPELSDSDEGYNIAQAIIAVGSGGLMGRGVGFGSQSQLKFLPEAQNDFIFAVIAEELGFLGISLVLVLFAVIFYRLIRATRFTKNDFGIYFLLGVMGLLFIEMFINIGMNIGLLPVVGISLPFLSYGGSAIVASLLMIGICENIIIKSNLKY